MSHQDKENDTTKHQKNIFGNEELSEKSTCANFAQTADKGKVTAAIAKAFAESEFEQYRIIQDQLYQSDFDRLMETIQNE